MTGPIRLDVALIHYPVRNRRGETIGSAVTNLDLHDIARAGRTFGITTYWVVTPFAGQQQLAARIIDHWTGGYGGTANPDRRDALDLVRIRGELDEVIDEMTGRWDRRPLLLATCARPGHRAMTFAEARGRIEEGVPVLILFGTAWGLAPEVLDRVDALLPPICGPGAYNHLSVRSAASIVLDRLLGHRQD